MKKYVSPELNVELFNLVDMIMLSANDFGGGSSMDNQTSGGDQHQTDDDFFQQG